MSRRRYRAISSLAILIVTNLHACLKLESGKFVHKQYCNLWCDGISRRVVFLQLLSYRFKFDVPDVLKCFVSFIRIKNHCKICCFKILLEIIEQDTWWYYFILIACRFFFWTPDIDSPGRYLYARAHEKQYETHAAR